MHILTAVHARDGKKQAAALTAGSFLHRQNVCSSSFGTLRLGLTAGSKLHAAGSPVSLYTTLQVADTTNSY
eukprot:g3215.t1